MLGRVMLPYAGMLVCMVISPGCAGSRLGGDDIQPAKQNPPLALKILDYPNESEAGQVLELTVSVTNTTQQPLAICKWKGFLFTLQMERSGEERFLADEKLRSLRAHPGGPMDYSASDFLVLAPGERYVAHNAKRVPNWWPGTMHVTCIFESSFDGSAVGKQAWVGSVSSSVDIDILPADKTDPTETD